MFVQYSFVAETRQARAGAEPVELTPGLATALGIGAMLATTLIFMLG